MGENIITDGVAHSPEEAFDIVMRKLEYHDYGQHQIRNAFLAAYIDRYMDGDDD